MLDRKVNKAFRRNLDTRVHRKAFKAVFEPSTAQDAKDRVNAVFDDLAQEICQNAPC